VPLHHVPAININTPVININLPVIKIHTGSMIMTYLESTYIHTYKSE
jgi:hypothetical protein